MTFLLFYGEEFVIETENDIKATAEVRERDDYNWDWGDVSKMKIS